MTLTVSLHLPAEGHCPDPENLCSQSTLCLSTLRQHSSSERSCTTARQPVNLRIRGLLSTTWTKHHLLQTAASQDQTPAGSWNQTCFIINLLNLISPPYFVLH
ncbi:hypothetical protein ATANTOWER_005233 [Ataeniobius toweri]|uniref:Uncharacterized protein n=1 Tax=Ataeniobius toweri TaxID=208326 RepID=A0ABU7C909_9TELE|nr:hypothetical protein [Ataeniobius toweri]